MSVTQITDYSQITLQLIAEHFKNGSIHQILDGTDTQWEEFEQVFFDLLNNRWLDTAVGEQLDVLGRILGVERAGRDDASFRTLLELKAEVNVSNGEPEILIKAVKILYLASNVTYTPDYPAAVDITHDGTAGLFILEDLVAVGSGEEIVTVGAREQIQVRLPDTIASSILNSVLPSGVSLTVTP